MPSHNLQHKAPEHMIPQLIDRVHIHIDDPVSLNLPDFRNPRAGNLLAHQHAHRRRFKRIGIIVHRQMAAGIVRRGAQKKPVIRASRTYHQHNCIALRLGDLVNPPVPEDFIQFPGGKSHRQSVHRHMLVFPLSGLKYHPASTVNWCSRKPGYSDYTMYTRKKHEKNGPGGISPCPVL